MPQHKETERSSPPPTASTIRPALLFDRNTEGFDLYVTNAAFPFFQVQPPRRPSLLRLTLLVHGFPLP